MSDVDFDSVDSGASQTYPIQCSALRKNGFVMLKNRPCKIVEMSTSTAGKHGDAKVHLVGIEIFTGEKLEDIFQSTHNMDVPIVGKYDYNCVNIVDGFLHLMDGDGVIREDLKLPEDDIGKEIKRRMGERESFLVTVLSAVGQEGVVETKSVLATD